MRRCDNRALTACPLFSPSLIERKAMCFADSKLKVNASNRRRWRRLVDARLVWDEGLNLCTGFYRRDARSILTMYLKTHSVYLSRREVEVAVALPRDERHVRTAIYLR